jgi:hypothetical protein
MKLPLVSRKRFETLEDEKNKVLVDNRILSVQLKRIQDMADDHTNKHMGNLRFTTIVKDIVGK